MKKIYLSVLSFVFIIASFAATKHTIVNSGNTFSPSTLTILTGDTVVWSLAMSHNVKEVDMATYNANGNTQLSGGFSAPFGGGMVIFDGTFSIGTHYYVCGPHAGGGMKATIDIASLPPAQPSLIISGVFDGQPSWASNPHFPKGIELFVTADITDLSLYGVGSANNGGGSDGEELTFDAVSATLGDFIYVASDSSAFYDFYGFDADYISSAASINGDDAIELFFAGNVIDVFADINCDPNASGTACPEWEYLDSWAYRVDGTGPDGSTEVIANWTISNVDDLQGAATNATSPVPFPIGTYSEVVLPTISFKTDSFTFNEGDGTVHLDSLLINPAIVAPSGEQFTVSIDAVSTATVADFTISAGPIPVVFPYTFTLSALVNFTALQLDATLVDDAIIEGTEYLKIVLSDGLNGIKIGNDSILYITITDNDFPLDTFVELSTSSMMVNEADGSYNIALDYQQSGSNSNHTVDVQMITGDMADIGGVTTQTVTFNSTSENATITITDDALVEGTEVLTFALVNPTNGLLIGPDSIFTLTIEDNDVASYTLGSIEGNDGTGGSSTGLHGIFTGVVNSLDRGYNGLEFSIQDASGSVDVYSNLPPFSTMSVAIGDEVEIEGDVTFFNGMVRIENLVSINTISNSNMVTEVIVTDINDSNESTLIRINELSLIDPSQWMASSGSGFDVQALDAAGDTVNIRIDRDYADLYNSSAPNSPIFDMIGVASQYDSDSAYTDNYQIIPRDLNDIVLYPAIEMNMQGSTVDEAVGTVTVDFVVANDNGGSYTVDVELTGGSGTADDIDNFATLTGVAVSGGTGSFTITVTDDSDIETNEGFEFTITNPSAGLLIGTSNKYDLTVMDNDANAIKDINVNDLKLYPNPAEDFITLELVSNESQISTINIYDMVGRLVLSNTFVLNIGNNELIFDVSNFSKGNYSIEIRTEAGKHVEKLLVK